MPEDTRLQSRVKNLKIALRCVGAAVNISFVVQACWLLAHPNTADFGMFCHWFGKAALGILVGIAGCYLEFKGSLAKVSQSLGRNAINRFALCVFYFWLGCYVMGGVGECGRELEAEWKQVGTITGIVAWVVSAGDLIISCVFDSVEAEPTSGPPPGDKYKIDESVDEPNAFGTSTNADADIEPGFEAPPGGWNADAFTQKI